MTKREWLGMIVEDIESIIEWSKTNPDAFNRVIDEKGLKQLEEITSSLEAKFRKQIGL